MKKILVIILFFCSSLILVGCRKNEEEYISLTDVYEEFVKLEKYFQTLGFKNLTLSSSNLVGEGILGRQYVQAIESDEHFLVIEFSTNEDAIKAKAYSEKYKKIYCYSVYMNILFYDVYLCYGALNNYEVIDEIMFSKDHKTLVAFSPSEKEFYELPECVETIACYAFVSSDIKEIKFNNNLKYVKDAAFAGCMLKEIWFNDGLEYIGRFVFNGCVVLKSIYVPSGVKYVSPNAFNYGNVFIDEEQIPSEWDPLFCSPSGSSDFKFFSKAYLNTEWEYNKEENIFIIK